MIISSLRQRPDFADIAADRGWHAWWAHTTTTLAQYRAHLDPMLQTAGVPFGLVAHEGDQYHGSVLVIESDLDARPQYRPWIAALWVEPQHRRHGVAAKLIASAREEAARCGHARCYLCATPSNSPYYGKRGFSLIEEEVEGLNIFEIAAP